MSDGHSNTHLVVGTGHGYGPAPSSIESRRARGASQQAALRKRAANSNSDHTIACENVQHAQDVVQSVRSSTICIHDCHKCAQVRVVDEAFQSVSCSQAVDTRTHMSHTNSRYTHTHVTHKHTCKHECSVATTKNEDTSVSRTITHEHPIHFGDGEVDCLCHVCISGKEDQQLPNVLLYHCVL